MVVQEQLTAEREQAVLALYESQEEFRAIFARATLGVVLVSLAGQFLSANPAFCALLGCTEAELACADFPSLTYPEDRPASDALFRMLRQGVPLSIVGETRYIKKDSGILWAQNSAFSVRDAEGNPKAIIVLIEDITERKQAQAALDEARRRVTDVLESMTDAFFALDRDWCFTILNEQTARLLQRPRGELLGRCIWEEFPGLIGSAFERQCRLAVHEHGPISQEGLFPPRHTLFEVHAHPSSEGLSVCVQDIHVRKEAEAERGQAEEVLRAAERFAQETLNGLSAHLTILDSSGVILSVNAAWRRFAAANPPVRVNVSEGANYLQVCDSAAGSNAEEAKRVATGIRAVMHGEQELFSLEYPCHSPQERRWFNLRATRFPCEEPSPAGKGARAIVSHEDITERRRAAEALHTLTGRLQALSHRLVEVRETERREIARELHDQIGQILTGLSLTLDAGRRLSGEPLWNNLAQADGMVRDVISRVRQLSLDLRPAMLDDLGLLPALLWHFERLVAQTGVRVAFTHEGLQGRFSPEVETAAYRIIQESLTNVARHAGVSEAQVRLWIQHDRLCVRIEDHGTGFDLETVLASYASSGLMGMQERVTLLGGEFTVESAPETGTRVLVELPLTSPKALVRGQL